jgi:RND family efflux transporter MFP subunit
MNRFKAAGAVLAMALLGQGCDRPGSTGAASPSPPAALPAVPATRVKAELVTKTFRLPAELSAFRNVGLYAKVSGFVEWIEVDRGSEVKAGQLLVRLVAPELAAQKQEAEAKLASDEATFKRLSEASKTPGVVAGNDLEIASRNVEAARARVRVVAEQVSYLRVTAPFDGVVTERNVHEGSLVGPAAAMPLVRIQELSRLRLVVAVPEVALGNVPLGRKVAFTVAAFPGETFSGTVARPAHSIDPKTRTMPVELDVDNADRRLQPGGFAQVRWVMERGRPSLLVPASAVATTTERSFIIRIRDGVAEWMEVRTGVAVGDRVEIFCDAAEGDLVAIRGTDELRAGTQVAPKEAAP